MKSSKGIPVSKLNETSYVRIKAEATSINVDESGANTAAPTGNGSRKSGICKNVEHKQCRAEKQVYNCRFCLKSFSRSDTLKVHERTHTGERPFGCSYCSKTFSQLGTKIYHERTHTGERPYTCSHCSKTFSSSSEKVNHERTHTGERPYSCSFCLKTFSYLHAAKLHERTHTGERPYTCSHCSKTFSSSSGTETQTESHSPPPFSWGVASPLYGGANGGITVCDVWCISRSRKRVFVVPEVFRGAVPLAFVVVRRGRGA